MTFKDKVAEVLTKLAKETTLADRAAESATTADGVKDAGKRYEWSIGEATTAINQAALELIEELIDEDEQRGDYTEPELKDMHFAQSHGIAVQPKPIMTDEEAQAIVIRNAARAELRTKARVLLGEKESKPKEAPDA